MHPATEALLKHFAYAHLPEHLQAVSRPICELALAMATDLPGDPETTAGLRKLLEAKDCFVRAKLGCTCIPDTRRALDPDCPLHGSAAREGSS